MVIVHMWCSWGCWCSEHRNNNHLSLLIVFSTFVRYQFSITQWNISQELSFANLTISCCIHIAGKFGMLGGAQFPNNLRILHSRLAPHSQNYFEKSTSKLLRRRSWNQQHWWKGECIARRQKSKKISSLHYFIRTLTNTHQIN